MRWIAWEEIIQETIAHCWIKADMSPPPPPPPPPCTINDRIMMASRMKTINSIIIHVATIMISYTEDKVYGKY